MRGLLRRWARSQRAVAFMAILLIASTIASPLLTVNNHVQAYSTMAPILRSAQQEFDTGGSSGESGAGLQIILGEGTEQAQAVEAVPTAPATPLDEAAVQQVVDRLPA